MNAIDAPHSLADTWLIAPDRPLALDQPRFMGVLNVTPDSFSDGGRFTDANTAVTRAETLIAQGAAIIDVGGESTRPGAHRVSEREQIARTVPVISELRNRSEVLISIDTTRARVAEAALDAGANIINDVSAGRDEPSMFDLAARRRCALVLMHRLRPPDEDVFSHEYVQEPVYDDVADDVASFLAERAAAAEAAGVNARMIAIDPGLGFGKTVQQNFELIARSAKLVALGRPVLGAASRKSFLGRTAEVDDAAERDAASVAATIAQYIGGIRLFRVHEVAPHREALAVTSAIESAQRLTEA